MSYYGYWESAREREAHEKAFRRKDLAEWDERWQTLSPEARAAYLDVLKGPIKTQSIGRSQPVTSADHFKPGVVDELAKAGFVELKTGLPVKGKAARGGAKSSNGVVPEAKAYDFALRVRSLKRFHLLDAKSPGDLKDYVSYAFYSGPYQSVGEVLRAGGIDDIDDVSVLLKRYVVRRWWPGWAVKSLKDPLAEKVVKALQDVKGPLGLGTLPDWVPKAEPAKVRAVLDKLIAKLAVFEDLDPKTLEIVVGLLPSVREDLAKGEVPKTRPELAIVEMPKEFGPDGSPIVDDIRAVLLELASEPPRLRQDKSLFQKEVERFLSGFDPLPDWFSKMMNWDEETRLNQAYRTILLLDLAKIKTTGSELRLQLTAEGQRWFAASPQDQAASVFSLFQPLPKRDEVYLDSRSYFLYSSADSISYYYSGDVRFLGSGYVARAIEKGKRASSYYDFRAQDATTLRAALDRALQELEPGVFYSLESVVARESFGTANPLNLGLTPEQVTVFHGGRSVPPLDEIRQEHGAALLRSFFRERLIPLGCVRTAIDEKGHLAVARQPLYDAYFGRKVKATKAAEAAKAQTKVVVQPDFSVIVIGLNPTSAAELAPFCERTTQRGGAGAILLKITRDSVVRAVANGLKPEEIADRLQRHATVEVPPNVLREVREWSGWVRHVTLTTMTALRCPDRETADRVQGALKRQAERIGETLVAIDTSKFTAAERAKLRAQGILIDLPAAGAAKPKARKKKSRRY